MDVTAEILQQPFAQVAIDVASIIGVWLAAGLIIKFFLFLFARVEANLAMSRSLIAALILFLVQNSFPRIFVDPTGVMWMVAAVLSVTLTLKVLCWATWKKSFLVSTIGCASAIFLSIYVTAKLDDAIPNRRTLLADVQNSAEVLARMESIEGNTLTEDFSIANIKAGLTLYYDSLKQALGILEDPDMIQEMTADHTADLAELGLLAEEGEVISEEQLTSLGIVYGEEEGSPNAGVLGAMMDEWSDEDLQAVLTLIGSAGEEDAATDLSMEKAAGAMVSMLALAQQTVGEGEETDLSNDTRTAMITEALSALSENGDLSELLSAAELPEGLGDIPDIASVISNATDLAKSMAEEGELGTNGVALGTNGLPLAGTTDATDEAPKDGMSFIVETNEVGTRSASLDREEYKQYVLKEDGWIAAETDVTLDGVAKGGGGKNVAVINGEMVREGDIVTIISNSNVFKYIARSITEETVKLMAIYDWDKEEKTTLVPVGADR